MSASYSRDAEIFAGALRLPPGERKAYLDQACAGDEVLRQRMEDLLQAQAKMGGFLEQTGEASEMNQVAAAASDGASGRVGRYRLVEKLGEGGCGVVYLAEQDEPVRRQVALKIIKPGMDTREVIARFEAERQALALMDHPGIAKVFDAGETGAGRPYFVMELIRGRKITDYCDEHALSTEERLGLFVRVCQAIQHAHQKGIIHRDIKPSNILVTTAADGTRQPVVIDFGIAKATVGVHLTDKTLFTAVDMLVGTPTYMSPEQTTVAQMDVDTRADIYSLGVLLYELLTGTTPFDVGELLQLGIEEVRRAIRETEPPRPSTRLSKMTGDTLSGIAKHRQVEPHALIRSVRGDLDWIVMKALEKDRARRYETANGLALDVTRFLADETISARPTSWAYRLQKTVLRHKLLFGSAGGGALFLVVSLAIISVSLAQERRAHREAEAARQQAETDRARAETEAAKSQQVTRFLEDLLQGVGPSVALGRDTMMLREILDRAVVRIGTELSNQPVIMAELQNRIGSVYSQLSMLEQAEAMHRAALAGYRKLSGNEGRDIPSTLGSLGIVVVKQGRIPEAEVIFREALALNRKVLGEAHPDVATIKTRLSWVLNLEGKTGEAESLIRAALAIQHKLLMSDHLDAANSLTTLGVILIEQQKYPEAEVAQREVLAIRRKRLPPGHPDIASAINNLCWTLSRGGNLAETEALMREALAMRRAVYGNEHPDVAAALASLSEVLRKREKFTDAESAIRQAVAINHKILGKEHYLTLGFQQMLGLILAAQGKLADAEIELRDSLAGQRKTLGTGHPDVGEELSDLGSVLFKQGKLAEAESSYRESVLILRKVSDSKGRLLASGLSGLGAVLYAAGQEAEAEIVIREAKELIGKSAR